VQIAQRIRDKQQVATRNSDQIEKAMQQIEHFIRMQQTGDHEDDCHTGQEDRARIEKA
jgi:hypothetical protein